MYCKNCGSKVTDETNYCTNCGFLLSEDESNTNNLPKQNYQKKTYNNTANPKKSSWRKFGIIIALCIFIACIAYLFITSDLFAARPNLEGNTYTGYYEYDSENKYVPFTITFDEHRFNDFEGTIIDDEYGEASFYGSFTGRYDFYFNKTYNSSSNFYIYKYEGTIDYENEVISGSWTKNDGTTYGDFLINID